MSALISGLGLERRATDTEGGGRRRRRPEGALLFLAIDMDE
jgi:hypothetical protein